MVSHLDCTGIRSGRQASSQGLCVAAVVFDFRVPLLICGIWECECVGWDDFELHLMDNIMLQVCRQFMLVVVHAIPNISMYSIKQLHVCHYTCNILVNGTTLLFPHHSRRLIYCWHWGCDPGINCDDDNTLLPTSGTGNCFQAVSLMNFSLHVYVLGCLWSRQCLLEFVHIKGFWRDCLFGFAGPIGLDRCQICDQVGPKWPVECTERCVRCHFQGTPCMSLGARYRECSWSRDLVHDSESISNTSFCDGGVPKLLWIWFGPYSALRNKLWRHWSFAPHFFSN